jgi:AcrR family transcriptional regulator
MKQDSAQLRETVLNAAEAVVTRQGFANLTLDAVAAEAGLSKGGLLHHFPSKDRLVEGLVQRTAEGWRRCYTEGYENVPEGPGRMTRGLIQHCLTSAKSWTEQLRHTSAAVFAALAQNPSLIDPMRAAYNDLHQKILDDGLPPGVGEAIASAIDGLWLYWVLGLVPVDQGLIKRMRGALEQMLVLAQDSRSSLNKKQVPDSPSRSKSKASPPNSKKTKKKKKP